MRELTDIDYLGDKSPYHLLDMYLPSSENYDVFVFFHGGGLTRGNKSEAKKLLPLLSKNIAVVSAEYRLLACADFPDFITDCAAAVKYVYEYLKENKINGRIFIGGSSAGAYITMMLLLDRSYLENAGVPYDAVSGFISESAQQFAHYNLLRKKGLDHRIEQIDETAPISYVKSGLSVNPALLIYYSDDMICRAEENLLMYKSMKRFLPEENILQIKEIKGKHTEPENFNDLLDTITDFIKKA